MVDGIKFNHFKYQIKIALISIVFPDEFGSVETTWNWPDGTESVIIKKCTNRMESVHIERFTE
jgi:hypothetical protein